MDDVAASAARAAAQALESELGGHLAGDVEAILHAREDAPTPDQYIVDPVSLAALIVSVASFAWTIYNDVKVKGGAPTRDVIERRVRVEVRSGEISAPPAQRDRIIEVVVAEVIDSTEP
ncbi:MAG: hypothetical protein QOF77_315 [Solirubrobacteraceae bacterium]|jgi:hypothetical protein|nr:hypothetical protein [Solirubrobacteraceae bacterium]